MSHSKFRDWTRHTGLVHLFASLWSLCLFTRFTVCVFYDLYNGRFDYEMLHFLQNSSVLGQYHRTRANYPHLFLIRSTFLFYPCMYADALRPCPNENSCIPTHLKQRCKPKKQDSYRKRPATTNKSCAGCCFIPNRNVTPLVP